MRPLKLCQQNSERQQIAGTAGDGAGGRFGSHDEQADAIIVDGREGFCCSLRKSEPKNFGKRFITNDSSKLLFCEDQTGTNPPLALITGVPALDVSTNSSHPGEGGLDRIGCAERRSQLGRHSQPMQG